MRLAAYQSLAKLGVSAIRINCQDLRPEVYGVEKMEIVTDYSEVVIDPRTDEKYVVVNTKKDLNDERGMI